MAAIRPRILAPAATAPTRTYARGTTVTSCDDHGTWLVALSGEYDLSTLAQLEQQTRPVWAHCKVAVIDLAEVTFLDSSLINWLLRVERALETAGCFTLSIVVGPPGCAAAKLFEKLRMSYVLACYATRPDAFMQAVAAADAFARPPRAAGILGTHTARGRRAA